MENVRKAYANGMQSVWHVYGKVYGTFKRLKC
jgi:hypothetical protein